METVNQAIANRAGIKPGESFSVVVVDSAMGPCSRLADIAGKVRISVASKGQAVEGGGRKALRLSPSLNVCMDLAPVAREILERVAEIGAEQKLKLIDAIHVTSAIDAGCDVFVTNDRGIKSSPDLKVVQLADL